MDELKIAPEMISDCCSRSIDGEIDSDGWGRCSDCKEWSKAIPVDDDKDAALDLLLEDLAAVFKRHGVSIEKRTSTEEAGYFENWSLEGDGVEIELEELMDWLDDSNTEPPTQAEIKANSDFARNWAQALSGPWRAAKVLVQDEDGGEWRELVQVG
ncbi:hypothetical protein EP7_004343 [Isosphaeraceae bacterium EP7]